MNKNVVRFTLLAAIILVTALPMKSRLAGAMHAETQVRQQTNICERPFIPVSTPLTDLGSDEYIRLVDGPTGFFGGLYPNGQNNRPAGHEADGLAMASQIEPLDFNGQPDSMNGRIVMISVGMSNTGREFRRFIDVAELEPTVNPQLKIVNGAIEGQVSQYWVDPDSPNWDVLDSRLALQGVSPAQVQVAWVKQTRTGQGNFPNQAQIVQEDLEAIARNLKFRYPNIKIAYYSSRTRSYTYWAGLSPEPAAFENGFAVKWMIEKQINGDASLNFDQSQGPVIAPYLAWGPYIWADGTNPRNDGFVWLPEDLTPDCTHPSDLGMDKVAGLLMNFFATDTTTSWFWQDQAPTATPTPPPTATPTPDPPQMNHFLYMPIFQYNLD